MPEHEVILYVYDLAMGMASQFSGLVGFSMEGIWHTSIVVFGHEWFYGGGGGIEQCNPGGTMLGQPLRKVTLGRTNMDFDTFSAKLAEMGRGRFAGHKYNLLENNCNNFSNELGLYLTGRGIPQYILDLPEKVKQSPIASILSPLIESMTPRGENIEGAHEEPDTASAQNYASTGQTVYRHFPHLNYIKFDQNIEVDKFLGKLREILSRNISLLQGETLMGVIEALSGFVAPNVNMSDKSWNLATLMLKKFPKEDLFPVLDSIRYLTSQTELRNEEQIRALVDQINTIMKTDRSFTNLQLSTKILCNLFAHDKSRSVLSRFREILIGRVNTLVEEVELMNNALQIALSSLVFNYAIVFVNKSDQEASFQIVSALCSNYIPQFSNTEALYRCVAALGTLICKDKESRDLALALDARVPLARIKFEDSNKLKECIEDCRKALAF